MLLNSGNWSAVKKECIKSRYQPVLMLYELENGSYVDTTATSTATCSSSSTTVTQITTSTSSSSSSQPFSMPIESHRVLPTTTLVSVPKATHSDEKPAVSERKEESYKRLSGQVRESVTPPSQSKVIGVMTLSIHTYIHTCVIFTNLYTYSTYILKTYILHVYILKYHLLFKNRIYVIHTYIKTYNIYEHNTNMKYLLN